MSKKVISTDEVKLVGHYSLATMHDGPLLFVSGQTGLDRDGNLAKGDVGAQTRQVFENLKTMLEAGGSSLDDVLKVTIYMLDMGEFDAMNKVRKEYFTTDPPASTLLEIKALVHKDMLIEIEAIAAVKGN